MTESCCLQERYVWLFAEEHGSAELGTEVVLGPSGRVVADKPFFVTSDGMGVFVAERVETSAAGGHVQERVEVMEAMILPSRGTMTPLLPRISSPDRTRFETLSEGECSTRTNPKSVHRIQPT